MDLLEEYYVSLAADYYLSETFIFIFTLEMKRKRKRETISLSQNFVPAAQSHITPYQIEKSNSWDSLRYSMNIFHFILWSRILFYLVLNFFVYYYIVLPKRKRPRER